MIVVKKATPYEIKNIQKIVAITWPATYGAILSKEQLNYMLEKFYSFEALKELITYKIQKFILVYDKAICLGFASYENHYLNQNTTRIHKIYVVPEAQGKGIGSLLINAITIAAKENNALVLSLNVNRYNIAQHFYLKLGFEITGQEDISLDYGYLMEDYKMEMKL